MEGAAAQAVGGHRRYFGTDRPGEIRFEQQRGCSDSRDMQ